MPSIKQNADFFRKAKESGSIVREETPERDFNPEENKIPNIPTYPNEPNPRLRSPLPGTITLQPDSTRQFFNPSMPQTRLFAPTASSSAGVGAASQSNIIIAGSGTTVPVIPPIPPPPTAGQFYEINLNGNFEQIVTVNGVPVV